MPSQVAPALRKTACPLFSMATCLLFFATSPLWGQEVLEADAIVGEPYGVARVVALVDPRLDGSSSIFSEANNRIYFPAYSTRKVRRLLRDLVGAPQKVEGFFLFTGAEPLELRLPGGRGAVPIRPVSNEAARRRLLSEWWSQFASVEKRDEQIKDYPMMVEDYLIGTLARRLKLPVPAAFLTQPASDDLTHAVRVLGGAESVRGQWVRRVALGAADTSAATLPLPAPVSFTVPQPVATEGVKVESIANRVPPELFYVRFGSFPNYLWFSHRLDEWSGEVRSLVSERSIEYNLRDRQQEQLCLKESALAEVLGPAVIADVALLGTDMFQRDGAAMGILFEARNSTLLANDIAADRDDALKAHPNAVEEKVEIGGHTASYIHTPDNRLRSYYLAIDNYHLVTTSRAIAERFAQVAKDKKSLGATAEFRATRKLYDVNRNDTVFVYLSSAFLENLLSPRFQIELQRRLHSLAEMDVLGVARVDAEAQGVKDLSIESLKRLGYLPEQFGKRSDGSELTDRDGKIVDSLRGPRGMFAPVPDVPLEKVTAAEAQECLHTAAQYAASWEQMTPIVAAISRSKGVKEGLEQVSLDLRITPLAAKQYKLLASQLGQPTKQRLALIPGDVVSFDAVLSQGFGGEGDYHLFGALRNVDPRMLSGTLVEKLLGMFGGKEIEGYLGSWPRPGLLWFLGATANEPVDQNGYSQFISGAWRRIVGKFTLLSFHPELLAQVTPQLKFVTVERPAQAWLHAEDLKESPLAPAFNAFGYQKATELSRGNTKFLNSLSEQLHVPPAKALEVSKNLLAADLVCALGGKYELTSSAGSPSVWQSTALANRRRTDSSTPADYEFPAIYWLRGMEAEVRLTPDELAVHADIQMPVKTRTTGFQLPGFSLPFGSPKAAEGVPAPKPSSPPGTTN